MPEEKNPLDTPEVSENNIVELFALAGPDLVKAPDDILRRIVEGVRARRHTWEHEENKAKKGGRKSKISEGLNLSDLNLNLDDLQK
jgi:hypothetical protein